MAQPRVRDELREIVEPLIPEVTRRFRSKTREKYCHNRGMAVAR
jgi:hypothetical protein